ncbi:MAG TPA: XdhC/CoxI family protein [Mycobacteriales bacterium]|nr:XdhC/CoxI family protein [Mycobacteriales bacterium]
MNVNAPNGYGRPDGSDTAGVLRALRQAADEGRTAVLVTVIAVDGQAPSHPGAKLVVVDDDVLAGTLGCSEFDTAGTDLAGELVAGGQSTVRRRAVFGHGEVRALELFAEVLPPAAAVIVAGDNPVGRAVADLARFTGWNAVLLGDAPAARLRDHPPNAGDAVLVSDHDIPDADEVLRVALASPAGFVGMLGSRRLVPLLTGRLREAGVPQTHLDRLRCPVGLNIGGRTPAEIALSIMAEIVATANGRDGARMRV